jgi:quinol monooxygenase YgiN
MIKRVVKLFMHSEHQEAFLAIYKNHIEYMAGLPEVITLELFEVKGEPGKYMTISTWTSEEGLENYRNSQYFKDIWAKIKPWFSDKPEAWTLDKL